MHDLRTETRRLLAHLDLRSELKNPPGFRRDQRLLKQVMRATSLLRDAHVQGERLDSWMRDGATDPDLKAFHGHLSKRAAKADRAVTKKLKDRPTFRAITPKKLYRDPFDAAGEAQLLASVNQSLEGALERVRTIWQDADPDDTEVQHAARIAVKRFRYMLEAVSPSPPDKPTGLILTRLHEVQSILGQRHDLDLFLSRLETFAERHDKSPAWIRMQRTKIKRQQRALREKQAKLKSQFMQIVWVKPKGDGAWPTPPCSSSI